MFIIFLITIVYSNEFITKCSSQQIIDIQVGDDLGFYLKNSKNYHQNENKTHLAAKKFFLIKETSNVFANAKYLITTVESLNDEVENDENFLKTSNSLTNNNVFSIFKIDPKIKAYLIDNYYSVIQTYLRVFIIATHANADLILKTASTNQTCVTVIAFNSDNSSQNDFLFKNCILNSTTLNCLLKLKLNPNLKKTKILIYYKIEIYTNASECLSVERNYESDFSFQRYKYKFLSSAKFLQLNDYNKKFSKQILFTPYLPFNVYIPKSEYRFENRLFISCEFLNDYLNTQYIFEHMKKFSLNLITNEFIDIKNITFIINKNIFNFHYDLKNEHNLQISIEKLSPSITSLNHGLKDIKSIDFCIEFLVKNDKIIFDDQINALIQWYLEINLPKFYHPQRNYSLNTTLVIQKSNLVKILPIIETNELLNTAIFTSRKHTYPFKIYALYSNNSIIDISKQSQCLTNSTKFKVKSNCNEIYFDGTETLTDQNKEPQKYNLLLSQQVQIKYKQKIEYLKLKIFEPELPLIMETTHKILNQINYWYLYKPIKVKKFLKRHFYEYDGEFETEPFFESDEDYIEEFRIVETNIIDSNTKNFSDRCILQYQIADISVYTKFFTINSSGTKVYFNGIIKQNEENSDDSDNSSESLNKHSYDDELVFDISNFVKLKIDEDSMAQFITKNSIKPNQPGNFNVQVISPITNQTYGSIELINSNLKQKIVDLKITPLNTLKLDIKQLNKNQYDFILSSLLNMNNNTNKNHSYSITKVLLDVQLKFNDYTEIPLNYYSKVDYSINITLLKPVDTKVLKILIDDKNLSIKFLFNSTLKHSISKSYKFIFQLFSSICYETLLASKEFEVKFTDEKLFNKPTSFKNNPTKGAIILAPISPTTTSDMILQNTTNYYKLTTTTTTTINTYKIIHFTVEEDLDDLKISNINLNSLINKSKQKLFNYSIFKLILYGLIALFSMILFIFFVNMLIIYYKSKNYKKKYETGHETVSNWQFECKANGKSKLLPQNQKHNVYLNQYRQQSIVSENYYSRNLSYLHPVGIQPKNIINSNDTEFDVTTTTISSVKKSYKTKKSKNHSFKKNFLPKKSLSKSASSFKQVKDWVWLGKDGIEFINEHQMNNLSNNNCSAVIQPKTLPNGYLNRWSTPNNQVIKSGMSNTSSSTQVNSIVLTNSSTNKSNSLTNINNAEMNVTTCTESSPIDYDGVYEDMANYFNNLKESRA